MNDQTQCANCGKPLSAAQSCDCALPAAKPTVLNNNTQTPPAITSSGANTEYEFSSPEVYDGGTGEYEFGVMQNKKTGEHAREVVIDDDEEDERGPTLVMDKPHLKKTIAPESAALPERGALTERAVHSENAAHIKQTKPTKALKSRPKHSNSTVHPGLFILFVVLFITFVGVVFFFMATTKQHFKSHKQDPAIVQPQK